MKKTALAIAVVLIAACNSGGNHSFQKTDTVKTVLIYQFGKEIKYDVGFRVTRDSLMPDKKDSLKNSWQRVASYYIPVYDTARDNNGKPRKDSLGKFIPVTYYVNTPREKVYADMGVNIDSLLKAVDTTNKK